MKLLGKERKKESAIMKKIEIGTVEEIIVGEMIHVGEEVWIESTVPPRVRRLRGGDRRLVLRHAVAIINRRTDNVRNLINFQFKVTIMSLPSRLSCHNRCRCK